jgi:hypothetical protein
MLGQAFRIGRRGEGSLVRRRTADEGLAGEGYDEGPGGEGCDEGPGGEGWQRGPGRRRLSTKAQPEKAGVEGLAGEGWR